MKKTFARLTCLLVLNAFCLVAFSQKEFYEIRTYKLKSDDQINATDNFLKKAYLPALHRLGIKQIGVFKPISNDTAGVKQIIVIVPYISLDVWHKTKSNLNQDEIFLTDGKSFIDADSGQFPFLRLETTLLEAFPDQKKLIPTPLKSNPDAIYEMRSYESPTKKLHEIKVDMFNAGGEIELFKKLDFQAVFYGDVLSGCKMPNLVYMIVFPNIADHDAKWKAFGSSAVWKKISTDPVYRNNISVSHIDSYLMRRTNYSDL